MKNMINNEKNCAFLTKWSEMNGRERGKDGQQPRSGDRSPCFALCPLLCVRLCARVSHPSLVLNTKASSEALTYH